MKEGMERWWRLLGGLGEIVRSEENSLSHSLNLKLVVEAL